MEPGRPLSADELRAELERTHDVDERGILIRAVAALVRAGGTWDAPWPTLRREGTGRT